MKNKIPSYPLAVEWVYEGMGKIGRKGLMFSWCYIQWEGEKNFSYYGTHIFKITDKRVVEYLSND